MVICKLIAKLQICALHYRFAISCLKAIAPFARRSEIVSVCLIGRIVTKFVFNLIEMYIRRRKALAVGIVITDVSTKCNIAPVVAQLTVILQHSTYCLVIRVRDRCVVAVVYNQSVCSHFGYSCITKRIVNMKIRVFIERCTHSR